MARHSPILLSAIEAAEGLTLEKLITHSYQNNSDGRGAKGQLNSDGNLLDVRKASTGAAGPVAQPEQDLYTRDTRG